MIMVLFLHLSLGFSKTSINRDAYKNDPPAGAAPPVQAPITSQATDGMDQSKKLVSMDILIEIDKLLQRECHTSFFVFV